MKRIAFMAHGPASGNVLKPLIERCTAEAGFSIELYAFHPFVATLWGCEEREKDTYATLFKQKWDYLFYGTGSGHEMERKVAFYAKKKNIKTVSILDASWSSVANLRFRYEYPPDVLIVPDESSKKNIVENNILSDEQVFAFGNPHFDRLKAYQTPIVEAKPPYDVVVFSQPSATSDFSDTAEQIKDCLSVLSTMNKHTTFFSSITVTPHPRENTTWLSSFCRTHGFSLETNRSSFDLLLEKDLNIGVNCTLQFESLIIGKPTIFFESEQVLWETIKTSSFQIKENEERTFNATDTIFDWLNHS